MPSNSEFFAHPQPAAAFKHGILQRYPVVFAAKAGSVTSGRVVFLDGYAGSGQYEDGSPGSPLLFVRAARQSAEMQRKVSAVFVEQHPDRYAQLCELLAAGCSTGVDYRTIEGELGAHLPELLPSTAGSALFAFLDPFGTALDREQLRSGLLGRVGAPTEVLLHFSVSTVARIGGLLRAAFRDQRGLDERDRKTVANVDRFLGGTWWRESFRTVAGEQDLVTATEVALDVAGRYCKALAAETGFRSVSMPVRPAPMRAPKYVLVLFTRHPEGVWEFASTLGGAGMDWQQAVYETEQAHRESALRRHPAQQSLFDIAPEPFNRDGYERASRDSWAQAITENIQQLLDQHGDFRITQRTVEVYGSVLGQAWEKHVRRAVKDLHRQGAIANDGKYEFHQRPLGPVRLPGQRGRMSPGSVPASHPMSVPLAAAPRPSGFDRPTA